MSVVTPNNAAVDVLYAHFYVARRRSLHYTLSRRRVAALSDLEGGLPSIVFLRRTRGPQPWYWRRRFLRPDPFFHRVFVHRFLQCWRFFQCWCFPSAARTAGCTVRRREVAVLPAGTAIFLGGGCGFSHHLFVLLYGGRFLPLHPYFLLILMLSRTGEGLLQQAIPQRLQLLEGNQPPQVLSLPHVLDHAATARLQRFRLLDGLRPRARRKGVHALHTRGQRRPAGGSRRRRGSSCRRCRCCRCGRSRSRRRNCRRENDVVGTSLLSHHSSGVRADRRGGTRWFPPDVVQRKNGVEEQRHLAFDLSQGPAGQHLPLLPQPQTQLPQVRDFPQYLGRDLALFRSVLPSDHDGCPQTLLDQRARCVGAQVREVHQYLRFDRNLREEPLEARAWFLLRRTCLRTAQQHLLLVRRVGGGGALALLALGAQHGGSICSTHPVRICIRRSAFDSGVCLAFIFRHQLFAPLVARIARVGLVFRLLHQPLAGSHLRVLCLPRGRLFGRGFLLFLCHSRLAEAVEHCFHRLSRRQHVRVEFFSRRLSAEEGVVDARHGFFSSRDELRLDLRILDGELLQPPPVPGRRGLQRPGGRARSLVRNRVAARDRGDHRGGGRTSATRRRGQRRRATEGSQIVVRVAEERRGISWPRYDTPLAVPALVR
mmetsp:Transcript_13697/g.33716  ORF Transcript_13697/g.33716 Transcript_13697/m.33716 type:complete len:654 (+) Transcript_13697:590-2551(+)